MINRTRRVKCDETKPECLRCSNFGRKCGGYPSQEESPPPKGPTLPVTRRLLSKALVPISPSPSPCPSPIPLPANPVYQPYLPVGLEFKNEQEYQYFCHFRDHTAFQLSTGFDPSLWNVLIVEACSITAIRQLVVAVAALSLAVADSPLNLEEVEEGGHHQYALERYGEALQGLQETVTDGQDRMRTALISALLIFCLESLQGNPQAVTHVQSAIDMITRRISEDPHSFYFPRVTALGSGSSQKIDQDLLTALMRLDRPCLSLWSCEPRVSKPSSGRIYNLLFDQEHLEIPRGFATIAEARMYFEDINWRVITDSYPAESMARLRAVLEGENENILQLLLPIYHKEWYETSEILGSSPGLSLELAHWHDAFSSILNYAMTPAGDSLFSAAAILHIQGLAADLFVSGTFSSHKSSAPESFSEETSEQTPEYPTVRAIISMSRRLVAHHQFSTGFVFDAGIIAPLINVWLLCPLLELQIEAIEVLESMIPRREGCWDSRFAAELGRRYVVLETTKSNLGMMDPNLISGL
jgi:hypothetical protein